ncbi:MAG: hypothetical protein Q9227_002966 [Pyrenula ochraceoflavens]
MAASAPIPTSGLPTATATPLSAATATLQGSVNSVLNSGSSLLDRYFPPERRENLKQKVISFATERPKTAAFLLSNLALSGIPLGLFFVMTLSVAIFALVGGLLVGLVGAVLFIAFAAGVALIVLLPTLFFTTTAASFIFLWGLGTYYIVKWFNKKDVPGVHKSLGEGVADQSGLGGIAGDIKDGVDGVKDGITQQQQQQQVNGEKKEAADAKNPRMKGKDGEAGEEGNKENKPPSQANGPVKNTLPTKQAVTSGAEQVQGGAAGARKKVGGVTGVAGGNQLKKSRWVPKYEILKDPGKGLVDVLQPEWHDSLILAWYLGAE